MSPPPCDSRCLTGIGRRIWLGGTGFVLLFGLCGARAQAVAARRVGVLFTSTPEKEAVTTQAFFERMRELGWIENSNVVYERFYAADHHDRLPGLAVRLVASKPDLIFAPNAPPAVVASKTTSVIPIVFGTASDPVALGLVSSLARPGRNVSGVTSLGVALHAKRLELLAEILPKARRVGFIGDRSPTNFVADVERQTIEEAARKLGLELAVAECSGPQNLDAAVDSLIERRVLGALLAQTPMLYNHAKRVFDRLAEARIPAAIHRSEKVLDGALFSYAASLPNQFRRAAEMVDQVLRGMAPRQMPVEAPTLFEFVLNMRTARSFGIEFPASILLRADRVIA